MIATIDSKKYSEILADTLPRKIETEEQNERYLETIEMLMDKGSENFSPEENAIFDLLVLLVEDFESKAYPIPKSAPHQILKYLLDEKGKKQKDLLPFFGSEGVISDILSGRRQITLKIARNLAGFLNVPEELFLADDGVKKIELLFSTKDQAERAKEIVHKMAGGGDYSIRLEIKKRTNGFTLTVEFHKTKTKTFVDSIFHRIKGLDLISIADYRIIE